MDRIIVAYPAIPDEPLLMPDRASHKVTGVYSFFYPAFPRAHKNFEVICEAVALLNKVGVECEVLLSTGAKRNAHAEKLYRKYGHLPQLKFLDLPSRDSVFETYTRADALVFPSKMETWGLPITEFKLTGKPMLVADLSYAHETVGEYDQVKFFNPDDAQQLAAYMVACMKGTLDFDTTRPPNVEAPFTRGWVDLLGLIVGVE